MKKKSFVEAVSHCVFGFYFELLQSGMEIKNKGLIKVVWCVDCLPPGLNKEQVITLVK